MSTPDYFFIVGVIFVSHDFSQRTRWIFGGIALILSVVTRYI